MCEEQVASERVLFFHNSFVLWETREEEMERSVAHSHINDDRAERDINCRQSVIKGHAARDKKLKPLSRASRDCEEIALFQREMIGNIEAIRYFRR